MLRRLRAAVVTGILWALVWMPAGAAVGIREYRPPDLIGLAPPAPSGMLTTITRFTLEWGLLGVTNGVLFALVLALAERGRTIATLSGLRVALWGAIATLLLPGIVFAIAFVFLRASGVFLEIVPLLSILALGAACGAAMLVIARRGSRSSGRAA